MVRRDPSIHFHSISLAARLAALGVPAFACTPDLFPDMMAAAIRKQDLNAWAAGAGIAAVPAAARDG